MKTFLICILSSFFASSIQENKNNEHPIKISVELPDTIYVSQRDIPIILKIENTTSEILSINNPKHWGHVYTSLKRKEMSGKANPIILDYAIKIKEHEILTIRLGTLDSSFLPDSYSLGKHDIYFKYYYEPTKKMSFMNKLFNKKTVPKFVTSNVFTFYIREKRDIDDFPDLLRHIR